ncbi:condensin-2 complex subunit H2-like [Bacillus rossius redtenbacheri]|uniref:condensin-2 complex subunit H2-like n=1 Tax=Bacillus rossius redtenbacheri TaxID=93214 RepID=UPI002FDD40E9
MDDGDWGGAENDALFDTMLKSILKPPSDLQKNWDVNLIKLCDRFLRKIGRAMQEGCSYVDFVEAAMVVQSSAAVYARKVDYLWVLLEKLLITFRSNPTEEQEPGPVGQEGPRRVRRTARMLEGEDYSDVRLKLPDSRTIDMKPIREDSLEEFEEADFFIQDLMNNRETGPSMPLFDVHDDMIGNLHDFRMNRRLVDGMWLADALPVFEFQGQQSRSSVSGCQRLEEAEEQEWPAPVDEPASCEPTLETLGGAAEAEDRPSTPDQRPPTPSPPPQSPPPATPPPPSPGQGSDVEISRAAPVRSDARLKLVDAVVASEELTKRCKADIPDKPLVVNVCTRPECVFCGERHEKKGKKECCKSEAEIECCLSGIEAMLLDDVIKPELTKLGGFQFSRDCLLGLRKSQLRAIQEPACLADWTSCTLNDVKMMFEEEEEDDDEEGDFRGFDLKLNEVLQLDALQALQQSAEEGNDIDPEDAGGSQHEDEFPASQGEVPLPVDISLGQDVISAQLAGPSPEPETQPIPILWQPDSINDADEVEARAARVMAWHDSLRPLLVGAEGRSHVDIHEYGSRLLAAFPSGPHTPRTLSLQQALRAEPREDTCRYFLAALMLANTRNVEISKSNDSPLAMDCVELTLLDRSRRHELMEEECASITTSDRSRKRKKVAGQMGRSQSTLVEQPLRESPNRINIMSRGSAGWGRAPLAPGASRLSAKCPGDPQPGPSWAGDANDWASDISDGVDLSDVRTLGANTSKRRKL